MDIRGGGGTLSELLELLRSMNVDDFADIKIKKIFKLGLPKGKTKKFAPVLVTFGDQAQRNNILKQGPVFLRVLVWRKTFLGLTERRTVSSRNMHGDYVHSMESKPKLSLFRMSSPSGTKRRTRLLQLYLNMCPLATPSPFLSLAT